VEDCVCVALETNGALTGPSTDATLTEAGNQGERLLSMRVLQERPIPVCRRTTASIHVGSAETVSGGRYAPRRLAIT
jgi:hypothetical protein